jgi:hypothetical protein
VIRVGRVRCYPGREQARQRLHDRLAAAPEIGDVRMPTGAEAQDLFPPLCPGQARAVGITTRPRSDSDLGLRTVGLTKRFGSVVALHGLDLTVRARGGACLPLAERRGQLGYGIVPFIPCGKRRPGA